MTRPSWHPVTPLKRRYEYLEPNGIGLVKQKGSKLEDAGRPTPQLPHVTSSHTSSHHLTDVDVDVVVWQPQKICMVWVWVLVLVLALALALLLLLLLFSVVLPQGVALLDLGLVDHPLLQLWCGHFGRAEMVGVFRLKTMFFLVILGTPGGWGSLGSSGVI